ncbi:MAG: histidine--tRNA ligase, partial [Muribaculaceae bacterium]|nr:histidine--tRNA ligase [Muribaculaceae bacterium]
AESARIIKVLRDEGISAELYPDTAKMKKQMGYADSENIPFVAIVGENEIADGTINLKDMSAGTQEKLTLAQLIEKLQK